MGPWIAALGIVVCMLTSSLFTGSAPTRRRACAATALGVLTSLALWALIDLGIGGINTWASLALSALLIFLTLTELSAALRRRPGVVRA